MATRFKMSEFYLKHRDTRPILEVPLYNPDGSAHDLTGVDSVTLHVSLSSGVVVSRTMDVLTLEQTQAIDPAATVPYYVRYTWVTADWDVLISGTHLMEYEALGGSDARLTFPNYGSDNLIITADLGNTEVVP